MISALRRSRVTAARISVALPDLAILFVNDVFNTPLDGHLSAFGLGLCFRPRAVRRTGIPFRFVHPSVALLARMDVTFSHAILSKVNFERILPQYVVGAVAKLPNI